MSIFEKLKGYSIGYFRRRIDGYYRDSKAVLGHLKSGGSRIPLLYFKQPKAISDSEYEELMNAIQIEFLVDEEIVETIEREKPKKWIYVIAPVRGATPNFRKRLEQYSSGLKKEGYRVYLPHRDTDQRLSSLEVNKRNREVIELVDEVHVFYDHESQGSHFDLGVAFAFGKPIKVIENQPYGHGNSYAHMLAQLKEQEND